MQGLWRAGDWNFVLRYCSNMLCWLKHGCLTSCCLTSQAVSMRMELSDTSTCRRHMFAKATASCSSAEQLCRRMKPNFTLWWSTSRNLSRGHRSGCCLWTNRWRSCLSAITVKFTGMIRSLKSCSPSWVRFHNWLYSTYDSETFKNSVLIALHWRSILCMHRRWPSNQKLVYSTA